MCCQEILVPTLALNYVEMEAEVGLTSPVGALSTGLSVWGVGERYHLFFLALIYVLKEWCSTFLAGSLDGQCLVSLQDGSCQWTQTSAWGKCCRTHLAVQRGTGGRSAPIQPCGGWGLDPPTPGGGKKKDPALIHTGKKGGIA